MVKKLVCILAIILLLTLCGCKEMMKRDSNFVAKTSFSNQNKKESTIMLKKEYIKVAKEFEEITGRSADYVVGKYNAMDEEERIRALNFMKTMISMEKFADALW